MNIYQANSKEYFLDEIAEFSIKKFSDDFSKLKVILPSGLLSNKFQRFLVNKLHVTLLPKIIPIGELVAESEEIFKIPSEEISTLSKLEEKTILAEIIHSYEKFSYDLSQSLRLAPSLSYLFFELELNNIDINELKNLPKLEYSEHWNMIFDFIEYAFNLWKKKIKTLKKITRSTYQQLMFDTELSRLKSNQDEFLLIAGVIDSNVMTHKFMKSCLDLPNAYVILPPIIEFDSKKEYSTEDAVYSFYKLIKLLDIENNKIKKIDPIGSESKTLLDGLLYTQENSKRHPPLKHDIKFVEFENIFHEAEYIAKQCAIELQHRPDADIAIVAHNQNAKDQYSIFLDKYSLKYRDLFGNNILKHELISLILIISNHLFSEFSLKSFFNLLSHPLINNDTSCKIKNLIRKHDRLIDDFKNIKILLKKYGDDEVQEYFYHIEKSLNVEIASNNFDDFFTYTLQALELLIEDVWNKNPLIAKSLAQIKRINWQAKIENKSDFSELLQQLLDGGRIMSSKSKANITICKVQESIFNNYDLIIITDLSEGVYPAFINSSPWLNNKMQQELRLDLTKSMLGISLYNFYLNLQNKKTLLTRSKRKDINKELLASPFVLHLKHILGKNLKIKKEGRRDKKDAKDNLNVNLYANSHSFPKQISATDIETLIRTPYNFYAKKILNLRKIEEIDDKPNLAEFGNFFHSVVEEYTKNYNQNAVSKHKILQEFGREILSKISIPEHNKISWQMKIDAISEEFIDFDEANRLNAKKVYSEIKGNIRLNIADHNLNIIAIADRIDVDDENRAIIYDYKTGAVPSKKDVLSGLSPQLIIESIILDSGGFQVNNCLLATSVKKLVYVKINSSSPYIKTTEIKITKDEINKHKEGLIELLSHYITHQKFPIEPNLMKYDDYKHLSRRMC